MRAGLESRGHGVLLCDRHTQPQLRGGHEGRQSGEGRGHPGRIGPSEFADEGVGKPERKADGRVDLWEEGQPCAAGRTGLDPEDVAREGGVL